MTVIYCELFNVSMYRGSQYTVFQGVIDHNHQGVIDRFPCSMHCACQIQMSVDVDSISK